MTDCKCRQPHCGGACEQDEHDCPNSAVYPIEECQICKREAAEESQHDSQPNDAGEQTQRKK